MVDWQKTAAHGNMRYEPPRVPREDYDGSIERHRLIGDHKVMLDGLIAKKKRILKR